MNFELKVFSKIVAIISLSIIVLFLFSLVLDFLFHSGGSLGSDSLWVLIIAYLFIPILIAYKDELGIDNTNLLLRKYGLWIMVFITSFIIIVYLLENNGFERVINRGFLYSVDDLFGSLKTHFNTYGLMLLFHYKMCFTITSYSKYNDHSMGILMFILYGAFLLFVGPYLFFDALFNSFANNIDIYVFLGAISLVTMYFDQKIYKSL